jgi:LETM1 and EF-hand domain-containing protein 1
MSFNRTASQMAPLLLRNSTRTALSRSMRLPRQLPAIAILIPHRSVSGQTSTSNNQSDYPPPGFNADQAKKPLESQENKSKQSTSSSPDVNIPVEKPTAHAPTKASEEQALNELASQKAAADKAEEKRLAKKKEESKNLTLRQKIMKEVHHYWDGTKLLAAEVKISSKLALKMAAGYELTRREHRQVSVPTTIRCSHSDLLSSCTVLSRISVVLFPSPSLSLYPSPSCCFQSP